VKYLAVVILLASTASVLAADRDTYDCEVIKVTDGDTLVCKMRPAWPAPVHPTHVRIVGVDTPESSSAFAKCPKEVKLGKIAKAEMQRRVPIGTKIEIEWSGVREKYGRVLGDAVLPGGERWSRVLIESGMARPYDGGKKSDWCK
jgi:endonuclease YncB( thermonuclease family)